MGQGTEFSAALGLGAEKAKAWVRVVGAGGRAGHPQTRAPGPAKFIRHPASSPVLPWSQGQEEELARGRTRQRRNRNIIIIRGRRLWEDKSEAITDQLLGAQSFHGLCEVTIKALEGKRTLFTVEGIKAQVKQPPKVTCDNLPRSHVKWDPVS